MMLWKTAGRCAVCAAALLLASFPVLAQKEHAAAPAAKGGAAAGKSDANGKPSAAPAPGATEPPAPQPQGPQAAVGEFQPVLHAQGAKIATCMDTIVGEFRLCHRRPTHGDIELVDGGAERQRVCLDRRTQLRQQGDPERRGDPVRRTARLRQVRGRHRANLPISWEVIPAVRCRPR